MKITRTSLERVLKAIQRNAAPGRIQKMRVDYVPGYGYRLSEPSTNWTLKPYTQIMTARELYWYLRGLENGQTLMMQ